MDIYLKTTSGNIIGCKSLILEKEGSIGVISNEVGVKVFTGPEELCDQFMNFVWDSMDKAVKQKDHTILILVEE